MAINKKLIVVFYSTTSRREPVREWLKSLSKDDKKEIGEDIKTVQYGWPIGMPMVENLGEGLWEIRTTLKDRISRVIIAVEDDKIILLDGFIKKTQKTPKDDLRLARKRLREIRGKK
mgnify:CR=1 FL=1|jgi:phage-related protein